MAKAALLDWWIADIVLHPNAVGAAGLPEFPSALCFAQDGETFRVTGTTPVTPDPRGRVELAMAAVMWAASATALSLHWAFSQVRLANEQLRQMDLEWRASREPPLFELLTISWETPVAAPRGIVTTAGLHGLAGYEIRAAANSDGERASLARLVGWAARNSLVQGPIPPGCYPSPLDGSRISIARATGADGAVLELTREPIDP